MIEIIIGILFSIYGFYKIQQLSVFILSYKKLKSDIKNNNMGEYMLHGETHEVALEAAKMGADSIKRIIIKQIFMIMLAALIMFLCFYWLAKN